MTKGNWGAPALAGGAQRVTVTIADGSLTSATDHGGLTVDDVAASP
jgi:hypothetical protein